MKKVLLCIFSMMLLVSSAPFALTIESESFLHSANSGGHFEMKLVNQLVYNDQLDQQQNENCGWGYGVTGDWKIAQSFIPSLSTLTRVRLLVFKPVASNKGITVSIRKSLTGEGI